MKLLLKCLLADGIMLFIHLISKSKSYFITGLALSFPGLSILSYYFMYAEQGAEKVRETTLFALLSLIPFALFLFSMSFLLKKYKIGVAITFSSLNWLASVILLVVLWNLRK